MTLLSASFQRLDREARALGELLAASAFRSSPVPLFARLALFRVDLRDGRSWELSSSVAVAFVVRAFVLRRAVDP
jgi:hypothetical protein